MWSRRWSVSSSSQGPREWRFYVSDMIQFGERVIRYTEGMTQAAIP